MTIRMRVTLAAIVATLLVATLFVITGQISQGEVEDRFAEATISGKSILWKKILSSQFDHMINGTSSLARDRATRKALSDRDVVALADSAKTSFNMLSASNVLDRLQLADLNGEILFSTPNTFSGITKKSLVKAALEDGKIKSGIERDDDGRLVGVVAFPLFTRGKTIGAGIFERELNDAIVDFKLNDESEVVIVDGNGNVEYATSKELYLSANAVLPELGKNSLSVTSINDLVYTLSVSPIVDSNKKPVAHLISMKDYTESYKAQQSIITTSYLAIIIVLVSALGGIYWYMRHTLNPLHQVVANLNDLAAGKLNTHLEVTSNDEIGQLQKAMKETSLRLNEMITQVNVMVTDLSDSADKVKEVANETCLGVEHQQSSLEQVATAMNQMSATVSQVASHANEAATAANNADKEANKGNHIVEETIQAITKLANEVESATQVIHQVQGDSNSIGSILDVIRGIAEQTNLLALNAAIEAARAGDHGRGFAVVADEVRTLASRTTESTQEIQSMIEKLQQGTKHAVQVMEDSREMAQDSVQKAENAGSSLNVITDAVATISDMNIQIASASEEQSTVAEEINKRIIDINAIADNSSRSIQETAKASANLNRLSIELKDLVDVFEVT